MSQTPNFLELVLEILIRWFPVLVPLAGLLICLRFRGLSARMPLLIAGLAAQLAVEIAQRMVIQSLTSGSLSSIASTRLVFALIGLGGLLSSALILLGLALVFADLRRRLTRQLTVEAVTPPRLPDAEAIQPWRPQPEGSQDIQP